MDKEKLIYSYHKIWIILDMNSLNSSKDYSPLIIEETENKITCENASGDWAFKDESVLGQPLDYYIVSLESWGPIG